MTLDPVFEELTALSTEDKSCQTELYLLTSILDLIPRRPTIPSHATSSSSSSSSKSSRNDVSSMLAASSSSSTKATNVAAELPATEKKISSSPALKPTNPVRLDVVDSLTALFAQTPTKKLVSEPRVDQAQENSPDKVKTKQLRDAIPPTSTVGEAKATGNETRSRRQTVPTNRYADEIDRDDSLTRKRKKLEPSEGDDAKIPPKKSVASTRDASGWSPEEFTALYSAYGRIEITAPNFWTQIKNEMALLGFIRSEKECQDRWFLVSAIFRGCSIIMVYS